MSVMNMAAFATKNLSVHTHLRERDEQQSFFFYKAMLSHHYRLYRLLVPNGRMIVDDELTGR
jgi:hypothetical protein